MLCICNLGLVSRTLEAIKKHRKCLKEGNRLLITIAIKNVDKEAPNNLHILYQSFVCYLCWLVWEQMQLKCDMFYIT